MWSVSVHTDCNKRGQTSRPVVGAEIQTSCNFEANLRGRCYVLGCVHCLFNNVLLESPYVKLVYKYRYIAVSSNFDFLLHKNFSQPPQSSKSSTRPATAEPSKSTEHSAIQKGSVQCTVATTDVSRLLSTRWYKGSFRGYE